MIIAIANSGGKRIDNARRPDIPPSLNINTRLYTGIKIPRPGSPAFLKTLRREMIINTMTARQTIIRTIASHQKNNPNAPAIEFIISGVMFPVIAAPSSSKEKFIMFL